MSKMIQIRQVPDELHQQMKVRRTLSGMSPSEYLLKELRQIAQRPTREEMIERLRKRRSTKPKVSPAQAVRQLRDRA